MYKIFCWVDPMPGREILFSSLADPAGTKSMGSESLI